jgi:hypothetical protein
MHIFYHVCHRRNKIRGFFDVKKVPFINTAREPREGGAGSSEPPPEKGGMGSEGFAYYIVRNKDRKKTPNTPKKEKQDGHMFFPQISVVVSHIPSIYHNIEGI